MARASHDLRARLPRSITGGTSHAPYDGALPGFDPYPSGSAATHRTWEVVMPQQGWSAKRARQYEHVKDGLEERGYADDTAEEIAARTVNKERARHGESKTASRSSVDDISSGRRGGLRSRTGAGGRTKAQLYNEARRKGVKRRSSMSKAQLQKAVDGR
jgi:hypothetical protein